MAHILIIDDDPEVCRVLRLAVERLQHHAACAQTLAAGLARNRDNRFDVVFLDVNLPDGNGLDALPAIKAGRAAPDVIIITGRGDPDGAELAVKSGVWDYIQKTPSLKEINLQLRRVLQYRQEKASGGHRLLHRQNIIGSSSPINRCLELVSRAAATESNVLLSGETGTGKELFALAIHKNSARQDRNFVIVDCAALPETLVESILFGHCKGAYTGAERSGRGLVSQADGGTLFLDEVGELPPAIQKVFLRVLQERRFRPVGARREHSSNFRLVAASNRDLDEMAAQGLFRRDLLYRLRAITIGLPPLRKRADDIMALAMHYLTRYCRRNGSGTKGFSPEYMEAIRAYSWPGNVRELINCIESSLSEAGLEPILVPRHLPPQIRIQLARKSFSPDRSPPGKSGAWPTPGTPGSYKHYKETIVRAAEKQYLEELIRVTRHDIQKACRIAQLSRARLYALLKKHGITGR